LSLRGCKGYTARNDKCRKGISYLMGQRADLAGMVRLIEAMRRRNLVMLQSHLEMGNIVSLETAPKIRIVIVEKHAAVRRALRKRLSVTSHLEVIATLQEPTEALAYLSLPGASTDCSASADVVLLGLQNESDEELFNTLENVRKLTCFSAAVIVLAPFADEVERLLMQQAGVSSYLLKYIDSQRLIQEIESASHRNSTPITRSS
jgi:CheY-like chemotaxis protein